MTARLTLFLTQKQNLHLNEKLWFVPFYQYTIHPHLYCVMSTEKLHKVIETNSNFCLHVSKLWHCCSRLTYQRQRYMVTLNWKGWNFGRGSSLILAGKATKAKFYWVFGLLLVWVLVLFVGGFMCAFLQLLEVSLDIKMIKIIQNFKKKLSAILHRNI